MVYNFACVQAHSHALCVCKEAAFCRLYDTPGGLNRCLADKQHPMPFVFRSVIEVSRRQIVRINRRVYISNVIAAMMPAPQFLAPCASSVVSTIALHSSHCQCVFHLPPLFVQEFSKNFSVLPKKTFEYYRDNSHRNDRNDGRYRSRRQRRRGAWNASFPLEVKFVGATCAQNARRAFSALVRVDGCYGSIFA